MIFYLLKKKKEIKKVSEKCGGLISCGTLEDQNLNPNPIIEFYSPANRKNKISRLKRE